MAANKKQQQTKYEVMGGVSKGYEKGTIAPQPIPNEDVRGVDLKNRKTGKSYNIQDQYAKDVAATGVYNPFNKHSPAKERTLRYHHEIEE